MPPAGPTTCAGLSRLSVTSLSIPTRFVFSIQPESARLASAQADPDLRRALKPGAEARIPPVRWSPRAASGLDGPNLLHLQDPLVQVRKQQERWPVQAASAQDGSNLHRRLEERGESMRQEETRASGEPESPRHQAPRMEYPPQTWLWGWRALTPADLRVARVRAST